MQKTAYGMRISDGSSDVCSSDLNLGLPVLRADAVALTLSKFSSLAEYAILAASLWIVVIVNDHATRAEARTDLSHRSRSPVGGVRDMSRYGSAKDATAPRSEGTAA